LTIAIPHVGEDQLREYLKDNDLVRRVFTGMDVVWNGSNHVGKHTDDCLAALEEIRQELNQWPAAYELWTAEDWLGQNTPDEIGVTEGMTDEEINEYAKEVMGDAKSGAYDGIEVLLDKDEIVTYLQDLRDDLQERAAIPEDKPLF
jgi:hypothetical protein